MDNNRNWQIEHYPTLPSTNDYCIEQARLGNPSNLAVLADSQTSPRGSRGRKWVEPGGNLAFSLLYWPSFSVAKVGWVPFVASLALYDAITALCGHHKDVCIKWPNDLLFQNKKMGGILIESNIKLPDTLEWLVIGFGLNIRATPELADRQLACLSNIVKEPPAAYDLSIKVKKYFTHWMNYLIKGDEVSIREAWLQKSFLIGTPLAVVIENKKREGIYSGIDQKGFLLLETQSGIERISAGEVFCLDKSEKDQACF